MKMRKQEDNTVNQKRDVYLCIEGSIVAITYPGVYKGVRSTSVPQTTK